MCGKKLKLGLSLSAVLFFLLAGSFSVYSLDLAGKTAEEIENLAEVTKPELQAILSENKTYQEERDNYKTKYLQSLETRKQDEITYSKKLMQYEQEAALMRITAELTEASLKRLESETAWTKLGIFGAGMCLGGWLDSQLRDWSEYNQSVETGE